jgi:hypothetical protein
LAAVSQAQQRMLQAQLVYARARNVRQAQQAQQQVNSARQQLLRAVQSVYSGAGGGSGVKVTTTTKDVEFQAMDDVKVRTMLPPEPFDSKGNIKKFTKEELKELKGKDKTLPGYESSTDILEVGQVVQVTLVTVKQEKAGPKDKGKDKDKEIDKEKDKEDDKSDKKMQVKMIVVLADADQTPAGRKGKKK